MTASSHIAPSPMEAAAARLPTLDGVRGLAILMVVAHNMSLVNDPHGLMSHALAVVLDRGWLGVQLFFVLSGFLITGILFDSRRDPHHYLSFFGARVLRIFPLYYATLIVVFGVMPLLHLGSGGSAATVGWLALFLSNWAPLHAGDNPLPHFWSLAVEEQFYLLWPFLIQRLDLKGIFMLCVGLTVSALCIRMAMIGHLSTDSIYQLSICRMDALACGGAAAVALRMPKVRAWLLMGRSQHLMAGAVLCLLAAAASGGFTQFAVLTQTSGYLFLSIGFALAILAAAVSDMAGQNSRWARLLRQSWLRRLGIYSYAMYVLHVPLHLWVGLPILHAMGFATPAEWLVSVIYGSVGFAVVVAVGALSHRFFESHFMRLKHRFRSSLRARGRLPVGAA